MAIARMDRSAIRGRTVVASCAADSRIPLRSMRATERLCSFRGTFVHQGGGGAVVALFPCHHVLQTHELVILVERQDMILAGTERILALERAQRVTHRPRSGEQRQ